jgi:hypothetical protein
MIYGHEENQVIIPDLYKAEIVGRGVRNLACPPWRISDRTC